MKILWQVEMRSGAGYSCYTSVSPNNAPTEEQARSLASLMFPELKILSAHHIAASDNVQPNELPG